MNNKDILQALLDDEEFESLYTTESKTSPAGVHYLEQKWTSISHAEVLMLLATASARVLRIKQRTIRIGNIDVPEPVRVPPPLKTTVYFVTITMSSGEPKYEAWTGLSSDMRRLQDGLCHLSKEACQIHADALIQLSRPRQ